MPNRAAIGLFARALAIVLLAPVMIAVGFAQTAQAHGSVSDPPSRNWRCNDVWAATWYQNEKMRAEDPMCYLAWSESPDAMWGWSSMLHDNLGGQFTQAVPDGELCSAGSTGAGKYKVLNTPGPWIAKPVSNNFSFNLFDGSSHGAEYIRLYISRQGYDPTSQRLKWSDLVLVKETGKYPQMNNYATTVQVPSGMSGHHILYTIWNASHLDQTYFFCSDIYIGGSPSSTTTRTSTTTTPTTTTSRTTTTTTSRSSTSSWTTSSTRSTGSSSSSQTGSGGCTASYRVTGEWGGGFQGEVKVTAGSSAISGWTVTWTYANGQTINQAWNASLTSSGSSVSATNVSWNGGLGAGASAAFGFIGNWNGTNSTPAVTCTAK